mmetsp:Transcript_24094/g.54752  ORF Transcript_24094/g.54752 Transcript_24094/m.54752 type:complete len:218 (-) Transcript_24094:441-1094(-)
MTSDTSGASLGSHPGTVPLAPPPRFDFPRVVFTHLTPFLIHIPEHAQIEALLPRQVPHPSDQPLVPLRRPQQDPQPGVDQAAAVGTPLPRFFGRPRGLSPRHEGVPVRLVVSHDPAGGGGEPGKVARGDGQLAPVRAGRAGLIGTVAEVRGIAAGVAGAVVHREGVAQERGGGFGGIADADAVMSGGGSVGRLGLLVAVPRLGWKGPFRETRVSTSF